MKAYCALLAIVPLFGILQDDAYKLRQEKLAAVKDWIGTWKVELEIKGPEEFKGIKSKGELKVTRDLGDSSLRFDGSLTDADQTSKMLHVSGQFTFDPSNVFGEPTYTGVFSWSEDGRLALVKGNFKGKDLELSARIHPDARTEFQVKVTGDNPRRVLILLPPINGKPAEEFLDIKLTRP